MAHLQEKTVQDVARSGPGLVFLTYPELVLSLPGSFIWAILFFAMLLVSDPDVQQRAKQTDFLPSYDVKLVVFKRMWGLLNCCHALGMNIY